MVKKVVSPVSLNPIEYKIGSDNKAHVWIRMNQEEKENKYYVNNDGEEIETSDIYFEADEVYFIVSPTLITKEEIEEDLEFYFDYLKDEPDKCDADFLSVDTMRINKHDEISLACRQSIESGVDVEIDGVVEHFSLTSYDQTNLMGLQSMINSGTEYIPYHRDGNPCVYYSAENMYRIIQTAFSYITFQTTYCNSMFTWIENLNKSSEIMNVTYGDEIPEEYQSDVLKDLLNKED